MNKYLCYDLDVCLGECVAASEAEAEAIFRSRFGFTDKAPISVEQV